ncbi:MAG: hypothetical protein F4028_09070, partial [Acidimicrobiaceae bacterium]|nr:hypothetical protein [Acidimicrobiaceae bacterium]
GGGRGLSVSGLAVPAAYWPFDSAGSVDGVLRGGASITTTAADVKVGVGALALDGDGDYVELGSVVSSLPTVDSARTISGWFKSSGSQGETFFNYGASGEGQRFTVQADRDTVAVAVSGHKWGKSGLGLGAGWHHVAFTYPVGGTSGDIKIYVDGTLLEPEDLAGVPVLLDTKAQNAVIGSRNGTDRYQVFVDDVRVYGYVLDAQQVQDVFSGRPLLSAVGLSESELDGRGVSLVLDSGTYASSVSVSQVSVSGIAGVSIAAIKRVSNKQLVVTLSFDGTDLVSDGALVFTVAAAGVSGSSAVSGAVPVAATVPVLSASAVSPPLKTASLDGARVALDLSGDVFVASPTKQQVSVSGVAGVSVASLSRASDSRLVATLAFSGAAPSSYAELVFTVAAAGLSRPGGDVSGSVLALPADSAYKVVSPDGSLVVDVSAADGVVSYSVTRDGKVLIKPSEVYIRPDTAHVVTGHSTESHDSVWEPTWGQFSQIRDHHNSLTLSLFVGGLEFGLVFKVFDDGLGFRFVAEAQTGLSGQAFEFFAGYNMFGHFEAWKPKGETPETGPVAPVKLEDFKNSPGLLLIDTADTDRMFLALLESDLISAEAFQQPVRFDPNRSAASFRSRTRARLDSEEDFVTPWRVVTVGDDPGDLLESTVALNLAAPLALEDTSWVQPGKSLWNWRVIGYKVGGFTYDKDTATLKRFVDFAADNNIEYVLQDDFWWKEIKGGKITDSIPGFDMEDLISYARSKGVNILIYTDRVHSAGKTIVDTSDRQLFDLFRDLGARGVKYGFQGSDVPFTREAIKLAAEHELLINFHDTPVLLSGSGRTYPNAITREGGPAQQDQRHAFSPDEFLVTAMVNGLAGSYDQTNGVYDLNDVENRDKGPDNAFHSTVAGENARTLIIFSGLVVIPDAPEEYNKKPDMFEFISKLPATWDDTQVLHASITEYITTARRSGVEWFVCTANGESGAAVRTVQVDLGFLTPGVVYDVTYFEDDHDHPSTPTNYKTNREAYQVRTGTLTSTETVDTKMVKGGGHCMWIRPKLTAAAIVAPVAQWPFDANANDTAGSSHGTLTGGAKVTTTAADVRIGAGALALDGTNDYVNLSPHVTKLPVGNTARTITGWFKPAGAGSQGHSFFDYGASGNGKKFAIQADRTTVALDTGGHRWGVDDLNLTSGWHHIAVTYPAGGDSDDTRIYLNGVQLTAQTLSGSPHSINTGTTHAHIGRSGTNYYNGHIDDIHIYNQTLTPKQIKTIYKNQPPISTSLTQASLTGTKVTLTLNSGTYTPTVTKSQITVSG